MRRTRTNGLTERMRFGINLRGNLAKLDDAKIASRYEALIAEKVALHQGSFINGKWVHRIDQWTNWRGPFHARIFYKAQAVVLGILAAFHRWIWIDPDACIRECELKDMTDEIRRRVRHRTKSATASVAP